MQQDAAGYTPRSSNHKQRLQPSVPAEENQAFDAGDVRRACMAQQLQAYRPGYQCSQERPEPCSRGSGGVQCAEGHRRRIQDHASVPLARLCSRDQRLTDSGYKAERVKNERECRACQKSAMERFVSQQLSTIIQNFSFCR